MQSRSAGLFRQCNVTGCQRVFLFEAESKKPSSVPRADLWRFKSAGCNGTAAGNRQQAAIGIWMDQCFTSVIRHRTDLRVNPPKALTCLSAGRSSVKGASHRRSAVRRDNCQRASAWREIVLLVTRRSERWRNRYDGRAIEQMTGCNWRRACSPALRLDSEKAFGSFIRSGSRCPHCPRRRYCSPSSLCRAVFLVGTCFRDWLHCARFGLPPGLNDDST